MKSKTTSKTTKKATVSRTGAASANGTKNAKPAEKRAHATTTARKVATSEAPDTTLAKLADAYIAHLEKIGKSPATVFSYRMDMKIARDHFGDETPVIDLTPERVAAFFESDTVTKRKNGNSKTEVTIMKTRRVFRQAMVFAAEKGIIEEAPLPPSGNETKTCSR